MNQKVLIFALALTAIVLVGVAFTEIGSLKKHRSTNPVLTYEQEMDKLCKAYTYIPGLSQSEMKADPTTYPIDHQMCQLYLEKQSTQKKNIIKQFDDKCQGGHQLTAGERTLCNLYDQLVNATTAISKPDTIADYDIKINDTCKFNQKPRKALVDVTMEGLCQNILEQRKLRNTATNYKLVQNGGLFDQKPVQKSVVISSKNLNAKQNPAAKSVNTNTNNYQQLPMWYMMGGDQEEILKWQMYNNMLNSNGGRL